MALFSLFKKRKKVSLIIDVGSASVGGAFVSKVSHETEILYSFRIPIALSKEISHSKLTQLILSTIEIVVKSLIEEARKRLYVFEEAHYFLSTPWTTSHVHTTNIVRENPVQVTEHFVSDVVKNEITQFTPTLGVSFLEDENILVEQVVTQVMLNGYEVINPYGKKARHIEINSRVSYVSKKMKDVLSLIIERYAHIKASFKPFTSVLYSFITKNFSNEKNYIACDVTGESTDMTFVYHGVPLYVGTLPLGRNGLVRAVSKAFDVGPDLALSYMNLYSDAVLEPAISERISTLITDVKNEWAALFKNFCITNSIPKNFEKVFITADEGVAKIWSSFFVTASAVRDEASVIALSFSSLQVMKFIGNTSGDPFLALEALDIHR
ncbi:MAG: hypothetical protein RJA61_653 [Candidatus Parcubacteria bacterium]|jgi:cell division ATPase FtsA